MHIFTIFMANMLQKSFGYVYINLIIHLSIFCCVSVVRMGKQQVHYHFKSTEKVKKMILHLSAFVTALFLDFFLCKG